MSLMITIRLSIKKDIDTATEKKILKLKGSLIAQSFTDIIHYDDDGEDYYINHFATESSKKEEVVAFIRQNIEKAGLAEVMGLVMPASQKK